MNDVKPPRFPQVVPPQGGGRPARVWAEPLEQRQLLAGHPAPASNPGGLPPSAVQAAILCVVPADALKASAQAAPAQPQATDAPAGVEGAALFSIVPFSESRPVQRMTAGDHFAGYDYELVIADQQGQPEAVAPPAPVSLAVAPGTPTRVVKVGNRPPKSLKPSVVGEGGPPAVAPVVITPLALTPAKAPATSAGASPGSVAVPSPAAVATAAPATAGGSRIVPQPSAVGFVSSPDVTAEQPVFSGDEIAAVGTAGSLMFASNKAADALAFVQSHEAEMGAVAYNFVHFNPAAMLDDAVAAFTAESSAIGAARAPQPPSSMRAWTITGLVVGVDMILVTYWYQKTRREKAARRKRALAWGLEIDAPFSEALL